MGERWRKTIHGLIEAGSKCQRVEGLGEERNRLVETLAQSEVGERREKWKMGVKGFYKSQFFGRMWERIRTNSMHFERRSEAWKSRHNSKERGIISLGLKN